MRTDLPDVNVLIALHFEDHVHHVPAMSWLRKGGQFATTALTEAGFVRVSMNPAIVGEPFSGVEALEALRRLRGHTRATFWADDTSLATSPFADRVLSGHKQTTDLHLLNLAASRDGVLVTFDSKLGAPLRQAERRHLDVLR
ncbi:PIN domain protein family protein [Xylanimonas cellulosilytica DSM 15894]|uniref:Ribonuclease VapC n=1 Tax=Xylanimonas cellulosilytica (strain DSM 15894 / JCM 12276 / CECT 5975 / KCTC 9989 / LMG 20990 / NBRC 107835 / XIL07) TaxID=446471 RepID=D1BU01_XYLCX|nr:TA system VapC family ribonuclease toxin [Xylanimonas cellulosilytica]ACZ29165.1 PIN domain protein family protein [Xylanimonas cellulosilytica DSM 15894]